MPIVETHKLRPHEAHPQALQVYNGLDCCLTHEVYEELSKLFNQPPEIYAFERAIQAPYLEMMLRGFRVDRTERREAIAKIKSEVEFLQRRLDLMASAIWGKGLNANSHPQMIEFFYRQMSLPETWISQKGQRKLSMNREVLEKLEAYFHARPIISCVLAIRDLYKQWQTLETEVDTDGRMRTSYNIAGTESGRPSSSSNAFGTGGNLQNIAPTLRRMFVADYGKKLVNIDLEQTEARDVGWFCGVLFGDWTYLDNCESGDLHTNNAKLIWPDLDWTGDKIQDRKVADRLFYRDFTFRDMSKRGGHLTNYMGTAWTAARHLKVPQGLMEDFQAKYKAAFPAIPRWWQWVARELQTTHQITTPFGRRRHFFGRPNDDTTLREAIAFGPQSTTADRMNLGLWRVWKHMPEVELLAQTYDSITFQVLEDRVDECVGRALELIRVPLVHAGRTFIVPGEAKIGWNWANFVSPGEKTRPNPDGLIKWKPGADKRARTTVMDMVM